MAYTFPIKAGMLTAKKTLSISPKHAVAICRAVSGMRFAKAKMILTDLAEQEVPLPKRLHLGRKYYSKAAVQMSGVLSALSATAQQRGVEADGMILMLSAHRGPTMYRGRHKRRLGMQLKITHIQAVLKPTEKKEEAKS